jgi:hypothetical protein
MRVLVAGAVSPFTAREEIPWVRALAEALQTRNVEVDSFMLPVVQDPLLLHEQMMALRLVDASSSSDLLVCVGYPAFVLRHPHKRVLLFTLASSLHEWFDSEYGVLATPQYRRIRTAVAETERRCLAEAERIACGSPQLAAKLSADYGLQAAGFFLDDGPEGEQNLAGQNSCPLEAGDWIVCESALEPFERIDLLLSAMAQSNGKCRLGLFVPSASETYRNALDQRVNRLGLQDRVTIRDAALSADVLQNSCACIAIPFASPRIPASVVRAVKARTPVIAAADAGGLLDVVARSGFGAVAEPTAARIAEAIDAAVADRLRGSPQGNGSTAPVFSAAGAVIESLVE